MKLIERLIEEGGSDSSSRNFVSPKISENVVRLIGRHFPSYVESDYSKKKKKHRENVCFEKVDRFRSEIQLEGYPLRGLSLFRFGSDSHFPKLETRLSNLRGILGQLFPNSTSSSKKKKTTREANDVVLIVPSTGGEVFSKKEPDIGSSVAQNLWNLTRN
ncbi:hypothetical protein TNCV_4152851 [Trichonephila clavipes]|nr:hypothetical protein TNCV_4152851 [Trichonephila clavipes]